MLSNVVQKQDWQHLIPHAGTMCLLGRVLSWDATHIHCDSRSHAEPGNPLRRGGRLAALHLVEYGAQAMAVHGGLIAAAGNQRARPGYLVAARDVRLEIDYIDDIQGELQVRAEMLSAGDSGWTYQFAIDADGCALASGRVSVIHIRDNPA